MLLILHSSKLSKTTGCFRKLRKTNLAIISIRIANLEIQRYENKYEYGTFYYNPGWYSIIYISASKWPPSFYRYFSTKRWKFPQTRLVFFPNPSVLLLHSHSASDNQYYLVAFIEWYGPLLPWTKIPMEGGLSCMNPSQNAGFLSLTPEFIHLPSCNHPEFRNSLIIFTNLVRLKLFYFLSTIPIFLHHIMNGLPHIYGLYNFFCF